MYSTRGEKDMTPWSILGDNARDEPLYFRMVDDPGIEATFLHPQVTKPYMPQ